MVKDLKKKYVPKVVEKYGGWLVVSHEVIAKQQIKYVWEWTF